MTLARLIESKLSKNAGVRAELEARSESGDLGWALFTGGGALVRESCCGAAFREPGLGMWR